MTQPLGTLLRILLLWCAGLGAAAQFAKIAVPFAEVRAAYPEVGDEIGWLLSLVSLIGAALGIAAGALVARIGTARVLIAGVLVGALVSFWQASMPGFSIMLVSRVVEGVSHLAIVVAAPTLIAQLASDRFRGAAMALWSTFFGVSFALVAWIGLPLVEEHGLVPLFLAHGVYMLAVVALVVLAFGRRPRLANTPAPLRWRDFAAAHKLAYTSPSIAAPGFGWLFYTLTFVSLLTVLPAEVPSDYRATVTGMMPLLSIAVSMLLVPPLLQRFGSVWVIQIGFVLSSAILLVSLVNVPVALVAMALFAALGLVQGASFAAVPDFNQSDADRALSYGGMAQMGNIGNLTGTPILLFVLGQGGFSALVWSVCALYAGGIVIHWHLASRRAREG